MKKMLCLVLSLMLLFACSALAEEEKEITFQGVPWGSSREEMTDIWINNGFVNEKYVQDFREDVIYGKGCTEYLTDKNGIDISVTDAEYNAVGSYGQYRNWFEGTTIAGYEIYDIETYWAVNENDSALLLVKIRLKVNDKTAAYEDLNAKLTALYGKHQRVKNYKSVNAWTGANNTTVLLTADGSNSYSSLLTECSGDILALVYGTLDAAEILDTYYAEYLANNQPETIDSTDTSGL